MEKHKINLLIVDDEELFLESMRKRLEARDFNVIAVNRGDKALEAARNQPIDIALVDLKMPGINGEETLAALKKEHEWIEIVILTGHGTIGSAVECSRRGAFHYLQKPCEMEKLLDVLVDAYKKCILNKTSMKEGILNEVLNTEKGASALEVLRKLRELDRKDE